MSKHLLDSRTYSEQESGIAAVGPYSARTATVPIVVRNDTFAAVATCPVYVIGGQGAASTASTRRASAGEP